MASTYAVYYIVKKRELYKDQISSCRALMATFRGICNNTISKQAKVLKNKQD